MYEWSYVFIFLIPSWPAEVKIIFIFFYNELAS